MPTVEDLWQKHRTAPFPSGCRCKTVEGIDLIHIDADTAGCVSTFLSQGNRLDPWRLAILGLCYHDLPVVVAGLDGAAREYFARLEELAGLVLYRIRDTSKQNNAANGGA
ncbi:MAG: hypothetical protein U0796_10440 [Gemmatales bacterium]